MAVVYDQGEARLEQVVGHGSAHDTQADESNSV